MLYKCILEEMKTDTKILVPKPEEKKRFVRRGFAHFKVRRTGTVEVELHFKVRLFCAYGDSGGRASLILNRVAWHYAPAALTPGKAPPVPSGRYNWRAQNSHCCPHPNHDRSAVHPLAQPCHYTDCPPEDSKTY
jgi:hypothetical protein